jgi:rRNA maturation RNase YbeY
MKQQKPGIRFHFLAPLKLNDRKRLKNFIAFLFRQERHKLLELSYIFCDDLYLLEQNEKFLNHHDLTDILTFPFSPASSRTVSGEIYISVERVRENAHDLGLPFEQELHRVIFHGALHLCHYKDKTRKDQMIMRSKEDEYLAKYFKWT